MKPISIILADEQYLIRLGLRHLLNGIENFRIVAETPHPVDLFAAVRDKQPDVIILDHTQVIDLNADTVRRIKRLSPKTNILIISADNDKSSIYDVLESGVSSFLT
ncbi:MAG: response regulator transcription factor, partial [Bacteroidota bacterium]